MVSLKHLHDVLGDPYYDVIHTQSVSKIEKTLKILIAKKCTKMFLEHAEKEKENSSLKRGKHAYYDVVLSGQ